MPFTAVVSSNRFTSPEIESTNSGSGGFRGARGLAGRFGAGLRFAAGLRTAAGLAVGDLGLRAAAGFDVADARDLGEDPLEPVGCSPVPGSGEESTVKPYQSGLAPQSSITKRQHQLVSSLLPSLGQ